MCSVEIQDWTLHNQYQALLCDITEPCSDSVNHVCGNNNKLTGRATGGETDEDEKKKRGFKWTEAVDKQSE